MNLSEKVALRLLSNLDPEKAHNLAIRALKFGFIPKTQGFQAKSLELSVAGWLRCILDTDLDRREISAAACVEHGCGDELPGLSSHERKQLLRGQPGL